MRPSLFVLAASVSLISINAAAQNGPIQLDEVVVAGEPGSAGTNVGNENGTGSADAAGTSGESGNGALDGDGTHFPPGTANSTTIGQADLERTNPQSIREVFINDPGVSMGSSIPMSQKLYVQGVEETNLSVSIDGTRQNNKIFHHNATTLIDPDLLKAVRVDPGVAPADAGPSALGGAIAFETKDVGDLLLPGRSYGALLSGEYITNGDIFATNASVFGRYKGFEALVYGKWATGNNRTDGAGDEIIGSGTDLLSGIAKGAYESETGHRIEAAFEIVNDDDPRPYRANLSVIVGGRPVPLTRDYHLQRQNYNVTYTNTKPTAWWDPKVQIGYSSTKLVNDEREDLLAQYTSGFTDSINGRAQNTFSGAFGSVTSGVDFYVDSANLEYYTLPRPGLFDQDTTEHAQNFGIYTQARLDWTERFRTSMGARVDVQHFEGVDGTEYTNAGPSLNVVAEYDVFQFLTAYAGGSRVWGGIPLAENYILNPFWVYPESVDPVLSSNLVAGVRGQYNGFLYGAKVFRTDIENARTPDYSRGPLITRDVRTQGYELTAGYQMSGIQANVGYAYVDAKIDGLPADSDLGRYLTTPIGHIVKTSASYTHAPWGVTVGAWAEFAFEYDDAFDPYAAVKADPIPGYQVFNAFAEWTPSRLPNLTLRAEANNIFDETYVSRATYGQEYVNQGVVPLYEPGRSFLLKATARF